MKFSVFQLSRRGGREKNEDRMGYSYTRDAGVFVLADGMGGHPEGEVAAQIALQTLSALFQRDARPRVPVPAAFLASGVMAAHHQIIRYASNKAMLDTPRTTLVAALVQEGELHWVHCGDSRLYHFRDGTLVSKTEDQSLVEQLVRKGVISAEAAIDHPHRNVLLSCLGADKPPKALHGHVGELRAGDAFVLCSDGLWAYFDDAELGGIVHRRGPRDAAETLIGHARQRADGEGDNISVAIVKLVDAAPAGKR